MPKTYKSRSIDDLSSIYKLSIYQKRQSDFKGQAQGSALFYCMWVNKRDFSALSPFAKALATNGITLTYLTRLNNFSLLIFIGENNMRLNSGVMLITKGGKND